jgi:hypothetical protein
MNTMGMSTAALQSRRLVFLQLFQWSSWSGPFDPQSPGSQHLIHTLAVLAQASMPTCGAAAAQAQHRRTAMGL